MLTENIFAAFTLHKLTYVYVHVHVHVSYRELVLAEACTCTIGYEAVCGLESCVSLE